MSAQPLVTIRELSKSFVDVTALDQVSLDFISGHIVGLLGPNGSGKSTLLRHIIGLYLPEAGSCRTFGCDTAKLGPPELARIGYVHQEGELLDYLSVAQHIRYVASYYSSWNHELERHYCEQFELPLDRKVGNLSPGQRQRLAILLAIAFEPELLLLDEPAAALDPIARQDFLDLLLELIQDTERAIVVSSHILTDVEKVIDHVLILDNGRLCRDCSLDELREEYCQLRLTSLNGSLPAELPFADVYQCEHSGAQALLTLKRIPDQRLEEITNAMNCQAEVLPLTLSELYRLVVSEQGNRSVVS
jgi:ABC-2 type transport system ATP-binding protein